MLQKVRFCTTNENKSNTWRELPRRGGFRYFLLLLYIENKYESYIYLSILHHAQNKGIILDTYKKSYNIALNIWRYIIYNIYIIRIFTQPAKTICNHFPYNSRGISLFCFFFRFFSLFFVFFFSFVTFARESRKIYVSHDSDVPCTTLYCVYDTHFLIYCDTNYFDTSATASCKLGRIPMSSITCRIITTTTGTYTGYPRENRGTPDSSSVVRRFTPDIPYIPTRREDNKCPVNTNSKLHQHELTVTSHQCYNFPLNNVTVAHIYIAIKNY